PQPYYQEAPPPSSGGGSGFLRSAATTAAGVAAGALAFEGIESLMHGGFGHGGFGEPGYIGYGGPPVEETVVNNYYEDPAQSGGDIPGPDMQPQGPYDDASYNASDDQDSFDDQDLDDQGSFDDGGGFDDGGNDLI